MIDVVSSDSTTATLLSSVELDGAIAFEVTVVADVVVVCVVCCCVPSAECSVVDAVFVVVDLTSVAVAVGEDDDSDVFDSDVAVVLAVVETVFDVVNVLAAVVVVSGTASFFAQTIHAPLYAVVHGMSLNVKSGLRKAHVSTLEAQSGSPGAHGVEFVTAPNKSTHV
jgi:hypothetical protein